jgi:hypothetical protein
LAVKIVLVVTVRAVVVVVVVIDIFLRNFSLLSEECTALYP